MSTRLSSGSGEEFAYTLIQILAKNKFPVVVGLRLRFPCWSSGGGHSHLQGGIHSLAQGPSSSKTAWDPSSISMTSPLHSPVSWRKHCGLRAHVIRCLCVLVAQLCPPLCNPMHLPGLPGFSVHGILQARILEWVTIPFPRDSFQPRDQTPVLVHCRQIHYHLSHQRSPQLDER